MSEWEDLCDGCGQCCHIGNGIACPKLDTRTNRCTDYENRLEVEFCLKVTPQSVLYLHKRGVLPDSCAYVCELKGTQHTPDPAKLLPFNLASPDLQRQRIDLTRRYQLLRR